MTQSICLVVTTIATIIMAWYAGLMYRIYTKIEVDKNQQDQRFSDLLQALVCAELIGAAGAMGHAISDTKVNFNRLYTGKTKIFNE
jgi:hypothetical protein